MPSNGQHSFLLLAFLATEDDDDVSMPSNGQHSFLRITRKEDSMAQNRVNALQRATLISTCRLNDRQKRTGTCQCPPTGNTHFYVSHDPAYAVGDLCQCPPTGNTHFYRRFSIRQKTKMVVSMPSNGQHSFLRWG